MTSDGYWSNSTARLSPVEVCSRPFSRVVEKSGPKPRIEMTLARPERRCDVRPGRRAIDSAIDASGSLPMSSAETDSTIWSARFFVLTALCRAARKPVTTIVPVRPRVGFLAPAPRRRRRVLRGSLSAAGSAALRVCAWPARCRPSSVRARAGSPRQPDASAKKCCHRCIPLIHGLAGRDDFLSGANALSRC